MLFFHGNSKPVRSIPVAPDQSGALLTASASTGIAMKDGAVVTILELAEAAFHRVPAELWRPGAFDLNALRASGYAGVIIEAGAETRLLVLSPRAVTVAGHLSSSPLNPVFDSAECEVAMQEAIDASETPYSPQC